MGANADPSGSLGAIEGYPSPAALVLQNSVDASTVTMLRHNPGIGTRWSNEEQAVLDLGLSSYALDSSIVRYSKISFDLPNKTIRDVALRCKWMAEKNKKRNEELANKSTQKNDERVGSSSTQGPLPVPPTDDDVLYKFIGGPTGELLQINSRMLNQIHANISSMQIQQNVPLFYEARDNILSLLTQLTNFPEAMKKMPPLPVKLNEELADWMLPKPNHP